MKRRIAIGLFLLLGQIISPAQDFKVVGYLPYYRFSLANQIDYTKLTHLNLAFLNPDIQGNLDIGGENIDPVVAQAKSVNPEIKILISLAGGGVTPAWQAAYDLLMQPANRSGFIHSLVNYTLTHNLDGIDVDLEWNSVNALYSPFVIELADSLHAQGKIITSAWPASYRYPDISAAALAVFDFVNLMAYDLTGPWAPTNPGQHSPYTFAQLGISYWFTQGLPYEKMTLGVPFYGYDFTNTANVTSFTYAAMVAEDTTYAWLDQVGQQYYNGIPTIRAKTELALSQVSGIMIWELGQDALGNIEQYSLLKAIDEKVKAGTQNLDDPLLAGVQLGPNPFQEEITLYYNGTPTKANLKLSNLQGQILWHQTLHLQGNTLSWNFSYLPAGMYLLSLEAEGKVFRQKLVRGE
ncbi:MAG: glycosyl hydrolase family 18 protein [Bacteroidia bacterium]|nr:glycosyl hydrolase family 18 protein [Bacteroidia bacterium]